MSSTQNIIQLSLSRKQKTALDLLNNQQLVDLLFGGGAGGGKSALCCIWMVQQCRDYAGIRIGLGRKELVRLKQSTVVTLLSKVHGLLSVKAHEFTYNEQKGLITYINGSQIQLLDLARQPSDPDFNTFGSVELTHVVIEEVGEVTKKAVSVLSTRKNRFLNSEYGIVGKTIMTCIPEGDQVVTDSGYMSVENATGCLLNSAGEFEPIVRKFKRYTENEDLFSIKLSNYPIPLRVTAEHPVLVSTAVRSKTTEVIDKVQYQHYHTAHNFEFRKPDKIKVGDWVRFPINKDVAEVPSSLWVKKPYHRKYNPNALAYRDASYRVRLDSPLDDYDFWWLVGYWLGDGWIVSNTNTIQFSCGDSHTKIFRRITDIIKKIGRKPHIKQEVGCSRVSFTSEQVTGLLRLFGSGAGGKFIPQWVVASKFALAVVDGYLSADGCVMEAHGRYASEFVSINLNLLGSIQQILFRHGVVGSIKKHDVKPTIVFNGRIVKQKDRYHLSYAHKGTLELASIIPESPKLKKVDITRMALDRKRRDCYIEGNFLYLRVKAISSDKYTGNVYNFETESHTYVAGMATVHNCNPTQNFIRDEYYEPYLRLGGGDFQQWEDGVVELPDGEIVSAYKAFVRALAADNPFISRNYIEVLRKSPPAERKRLLEGNWDYDDNDSLLFTQQFFDRSLTGELSKGEIFIGLDVADKGNDKSIATLIEDNIITDQQEFVLDPQSGLTESDQTALALIKYAQQHGLDSSKAQNIGVDTVGVGVGVRDFMRNKGWHITEFIAGASATEDGFNRLRSQAFWGFSQDMQAGQIRIYNNLPTLADLRKELRVHEYDYDTESKQVKVMPKPKIKESLGYSPDYADSANIARWVARRPKEDYGVLW